MKKCEITLRNITYRVWIVELILISIYFYSTVPPEKPVIMNEKTEEIDHTRPYFEGATVKLTCMVSGGNIKLIKFKFSTYILHTDIFVFD